MEKLIIQSRIKHNACKSETPHSKFRFPKIFIRNNYLFDFRFFRFVNIISFIIQFSKPTSSLFMTVLVFFCPLKKETYYITTILFYPLKRANKVRFIVE